MVELEGREEFVCGGRNAVRNEEGGCTDGCDDSFFFARDVAEM